MLNNNFNIPTIVFVKPENSANVGSLTRVMKNFGLSDLCIVSLDKQNYEKRIAHKFAVEATDIVDQTKFCDSLQEAIKNKKWVVGLTAGIKEKYIPMDLLTCSFEDLWGETFENVNPKDVAIVFGGESNGLELNDRALCNRLIKIPVSTDYESMNIAMSAGVYLFHSWVVQCKGIERFSQKAIAVNTKSEMNARNHRKTTFDEKESVIKYFMDTLEKTSFFKFPDKVKVKNRIFRMISEWDIGDLLFFSESLYHINAKIDGNFGDKDFLKKAKKED